MHAGDGLFWSLCAVDRLEEFKLKEKRFELGAGELPFNSADHACKLQAARMPERRLQQALETAAQIRRAADVGLGAGVFTIKREDRRHLRQRRKRRFRIGRIETN